MNQNYLGVVGYTTIFVKYDLKEAPVHIDIFKAEKGFKDGKSQYIQTLANDGYIKYIKIINIVMETYLADVIQVSTILSKFTCTLGLSVYTDNAYTKASLLNKKDSLQYADFKALRGGAKVHQCDEQLPVYRIITDGDNSYFAEGILVRN